MGSFISHISFKLKNQVKMYFDFIENLEYRENKTIFTCLLTFNCVFSFYFLYTLIIKVQFCILFFFSFNIEYPKNSHMY